MFTIVSSGTFTSGMFGGDLNIINTTRVPISKADRDKLAPQSTAKFDQFHLEGMRSLPVDESAGIGPEEEGGQGEDEAVAQQGEQMVLHDLEQEPDGRSASEHPPGDLLVPP